MRLGQIVCENEWVRCLSPFILWCLALLEKKDWEPTPREGARAAKWRKIAPDRAVTPGVTGGGGCEEVPITEGGTRGVKVAPGGGQEEGLVRRDAQRGHTEQRSRAADGQLAPALGTGRWRAAKRSRQPLCT